MIANQLNRCQPSQYSSCSNEGVHQTCSTMDHCSGHSQPSMQLVLFVIRLFRELGNFKAAVAISTHLNDFVAAAETCEEEAHMLAAREPARAEQKLQEAIRHYKKAKQHLQGFQLLQRHPTLFKNMAPEVSVCCCTVTCSVRFSSRHICCCVLNPYKL